MQRPAGVSGMKKEVAVADESQEKDPLSEDFSRAQERE
jgi:hypothetical protein